MPFSVGEFGEGGRKPSIASSISLADNIVAQDRDAVADFPIDRPVGERALGQVGGEEALEGERLQLVARLGGVLPRSITLTLSVNGVFSKWSAGPAFGAELEATRLNSTTPVLLLAEPAVPMNFTVALPEVIVTSLSPM